MSVDRSDQVPRSAGRRLGRPLAVLIPLAGPLLLRAVGASTATVPAAAAAAGVLVLVGSAAAWVAAPSPAPAAWRSLAASAAFALAALAALALVRPHWSLPAPNVRDMPAYVLHGLGPLFLAVLLVSLGGYFSGRLSAGRHLVGTVDVVHWSLGAVLVCLAGMPPAIAGALAGHWVARAAAAWIMAGACAFWTRWALAEPGAGAEAPVAAVQRPPLATPRRDPTTRRPGGRQRMPRPRGRRRSAPAEPFRRPSPQPVRVLLTGVWNALRIRPQGRPLPVSVSVIDARARTARLLSLWAWSALGTAPLLLLVVLGGRAGWLWVDPGRLPAPWPVLALGTAFLALALPTALALRRRLIHPLELLLPVPRALPWLAFTAGAFVLERLGTATVALGQSGLAAALHGGPLPVIAAIWFLAAAQGAFCQGLLQTRLEDAFPRWIALLAPAVFLALSGPVTGVPLPPPLWTLLLGIWLGLTRRTQGAAGSAASLAVAGSLAILVGH